ncbi:MAG: 2-oxoacid:acceptor oxidoreductase family protein [Betaproteobacteria bacterium]
MKWNICISGTGGQGIVLAGIILAEAAILEDKHSIQIQSYGPEARGGASKSEVIISDQEIDYPKVLTADVLLAMSQQACDKYANMLRPGGKLIVDSNSVESVPDVNAEVLQIPFTTIAKEQCGKAMFANIIALGALVARTGMIREESLYEAVLARVPPGTEKVNRQALASGLELGRG